MGGQQNGAELLHLPVDAIHANPRQPRKRFEPEATAGLAAGFLNTLAGGGSVITLPVLGWITGHPGVANATNRIARSHRIGRIFHVSGHDRKRRRFWITAQHGEWVRALVAGHALAEHASPGEATLQVLRGRVRLVVKDRSWPGAAGDLLVIPDARHALHADEDAVVLLTVARG